MKWWKIAAIPIGLVLVALAFFVAYGIPAKALVASFGREFAAKNNLQLSIGGPVRLTVWPQLGLVADKVALRPTEASADVFAVDRVRLGFALADLLKGHVRVTDVALTRPVTRSELRATTEAGNARQTGARADDPLGVFVVDTLFAIHDLTAEDASFVLRERGEEAELQIKSLHVTAALPSRNARLDLRAVADIGGRVVRVTANADAPGRLAEGKPVPVEATIEAQSVLRSPATISASVQATGPVLRIDGLKASTDQGRFAGSVSVSFAAAKPFIDADIDAERLDLTSLLDGLATATAPPAPARAVAPWSDEPLSFFGLRVVEAAVKLTAREVLLRNVRIAPAAIEGTLLRDVLTVSLARSELYGGQAMGELVVDASAKTPTFALRGGFSGVQALPFLTDAAAFSNLEGRARTAFDVKFSGASPQRMISTMNGSADVLFEEGSLRGISVPTMVRSLAETILSGWGENASQQTKFSTFAARFAVQNGVARTDDLRFTGPFVRMSGAGAVDLRAQTIDFRTDPQLVTSPDGQGGRTDSWGIGVPVLIQGPWNAPRFYADLPNILSNPESVLRRFRDSLGGRNGQTGAPIGRVMEGLVQGLDKGQGGVGGIVDDMLRAFGGGEKGGGSGSGRAQDLPSLPPPPVAAPPAPVAAPPPAPSPDPDAEGLARDLLKGLFGR